MNPKTKVVLRLIIKAIKLCASESMPYWRAQKVDEILDKAMETMEGQDIKYED